MKRISKIVLLVAILANTLIPAWAQSSTQGKEFWVSLVPSQYAEADNADYQKASKSSNGFNAYIAISAQKACDVRISNPRTGWTYSVSVNANEWKEVGKNGEIPIAQWYTPDAMPTSEQAYDLGLKVEATEEVSVYCSLRWGYSADATNILPIDALQSEYIVQTYEAIKQDIMFDGSSSLETDGNDFNGVQKNCFTILAAEDCTVDVELTAPTSGGRTGKIEGISLYKGQVYHVLSAKDQNISGSRVVARDGKKIAVFAGAPATRLPNAFSDRDLLYEQLFPIDYWGQSFIVVRSKQKDANRVIITAQENDTRVTIHGNYDPSTSKFEDHTIKKDYSFTLDAGKSYEFEMSNGYADKRWHKKRSAFKGITVIDSTTYITTSCPCAVVSYDVGSKYIREEVDESSSGEKHLTETYHTHKDDGDIKDVWGAPSMTWIAPVEQMMNEVVFGVMGTIETNRHFVNIVVPEQGINEAKLNGVSLASYFHPVESNNDYAYARITLPETRDGEQNPFYRLECRSGFIATVYGNGHNESYAYTAGSSTIKRGISVDGVKIIDDEESPTPFCIDQELTFNPKVNSDIIDKVEWDFDDNVTYVSTEPDEIIKHTYSSPGFYNITAVVYAHKNCPDTVYPPEAVNFRIQVVRPDTVIMSAEKVCITLNEYKQDPVKCQKLLDEGNDSIVQEHCYDPVQIYRIVYGLETETYRIDEKDVPENAKLLPSADPAKPDTVRFSLTDDEEAFFYGKTYVSSQEIVDTVVQRELPHCNHYRHAYVDVQTCLGVNIVQDDEVRDTLQVCPGDSMRAFCVKVRGNIEKDADGNSNAIFIVDGWAEPKDIQIVEIPDKDSIEIIFPTDSMKTPGVYNAELILFSAYKSERCDSVIKKFAFTVNFSDTIFQYKFNNVLAIYSSAFNGGYTFSNYEWHRIRKDEVTGEEVNEIVGGNSPVYRDTVPFHLYDVYYVRLTAVDSLGTEMTLNSCEQTIKNVPGVETPQPAEEAPAQKVIYHDRLVIRKGELMYDIYGQRIQ